MSIRSVSPRAPSLASAEVKAWEPGFNSENDRFYSKITVEPSNAEKETFTVPRF